MKRYFIMQRPCREVIISLFSRTCVALALIIASIGASGCGLRHRGITPLDIDGSKAGLAADEQLKFDANTKAPRQMYVAASRVLPRVDLNLTPEVQMELDRFMTKDRTTVNDILAKGADKFGPMAKVLEGAGVPVELVSVAAVESGLNTKAASPAGAKGMWQFMKSTAQVYGLKVDRSRDDRTDFNRSTHAAAQHLRDLFIAFQDWHLALAAYNAGRGAINRLLNRTGGDDFWDLARGGHLPGETKRFVPKVIALSLIVSNPDQYGFEGRTLR
jgi:membrane-bound lytic murein transglycosylase D